MLKKHGVHRLFRIHLMIVCDGNNLIGLACELSGRSGMKCVRRRRCGEGELSVRKLVFSIRKLTWTWLLMRCELLDQT